MTGKATFGFVSKYEKGANVPTGETEFNFQVANFNFHSALYQWLVISGPMAQYGSDNYNFLLTGRDGALVGGPMAVVSFRRATRWTPRTCIDSVVILEVRGK